MELVLNVHQNHVVIEMFNDLMMKKKKAEKMLHLDKM
jgi:hypothetical protein